MLQQTQVDRVIPFYKKFIKQFPTASRLAAAPLSEVLKSWQGLGYNRRAKMLHAAAKDLASIGKLNFKNSGKFNFPMLVAGLEKLPGVGPYTARAVAAFAYNQDVIVIETNIRTAIIHHFFPKKKKVSDIEIEKVLTLALPRGRSREWYSALMDYGAHLKHSGVSHNAKSKGYTKQSTFKGSLREVRGAIVRVLAAPDMPRSNLKNLAPRFDLGISTLIFAVEKEIGANRRAQIREALKTLCAERLVYKMKGMYTLGDHPIE